eukprot:Clim_evm2s13 gene=Clim_evmTU2s13
MAEKKSKKERRSSRSSAKETTRSPSRKRKADEVVEKTTSNGSSHTKTTSKSALRIEIEAKENGFDVIKSGNSGEISHICQFGDGLFSAIADESSRENWSAEKQRDRDGKDVLRLYHSGQNLNYSGAAVGEDMRKSAIATVERNGKGQLVLRVKPVDVHNLQLTPLPEHLKSVTTAADIEAEGRIEREGDEAVDDKDQAEAERQIAARVALVDEFGAKKKRQQYEARARARVDVDGVAQGSLREMHSTVREFAKDHQVKLEQTLNSTIGGDSLDDTGALLTQSASLASVMGGNPLYPHLPPHDAETEDMGEAYKLSNMLPTAALEALRPLTRDFTSTDEKYINKLMENGELPTFIGQIMKEGRVGEHKNQRALGIAYLYYLMQLYILKGPSKLANLAQTLGNVPQSFADHLTETFTILDSSRQPPQRIVTDALRNRLLCYIFVVSMMVNDYVVEPTPLVKDLQISLQRVRTIAKAVSARISYRIDPRAVSTKRDGTPKRQLVFKLSVPLTFPAAKRPPARRG